MKQNTNIKEILFDFGGVIYDIDFMRCAMAFMDLGIEDFEDLYSRAAANHLFTDYETGSISSSQFRDSVRELSRMKLTDNQINTAWNALLTGFVPERMNLIKKIKNHYKIYLLSNTCEIHYNTFRGELQEHFGYREFDDLFYRSWFSFKMGMRKPSAAIFNRVFEEGNIDRSTTLFIDDTLQNIVAARELGIQTYFLDQKRNEDIRDLFDDEGILRFNNLNTD